MLLAANKHAHFTIVIPQNADPAERHAADELQKHFDRMSLAWPAIVTDAEPAPSRSIQLGATKHAKQAVREKLGREDYALRTDGRRLFITGGSPRGTLYGAYDLLERLGVRWWTPDETHIPRLATVSIGELDETVRPPLVYRAIWYRHIMDPDWQARQRLDAGTMGPVYLRERHGGMERFAADASGHTYHGLVPTEKYFDKHPDYFSEVKGVRLRHHNQLCATNPQVADIAARTAAEWIERTPGTHIISVTQNDWGNWCTCKTCAAMIARTGAPSGPMLHLANRVAERLEKRYPHVLVDTFAYAWSQTAPNPRKIKAHPNVLIRLAPIGNCFGHPIRACDANKDCRAALKTWSKIARHLFVWHYVTDFFHYLAPTPNLPPLEDDLNYYLDHGVKGMFLQGNGTSLGGDMNELKAYVEAKLLWNPRKVKMRDVREEFLRGYYRAAAPHVEDYLATFEKTLAKSGEHFHLYRSLGANTANYLKRSTLDRGRAALAAGREAAADDPAVLERLDRIEPTLDYTELFYHERPKLRKLNVTRTKLICPVSPRRREMTERLFRWGDRRKITHYAEDLGRYTTMRQLRHAWSDSAGEHPAIALRNGGSEAIVVPAIGGRIVWLGGAGAKTNLLAEGLPGTFGYPCVGGYEEYTLTNHQSAGFAQPFEVVKRGKSEVKLRAAIETGHTLDRRIWLSPRGEAFVVSTLRNPTDAALPGCLRAHLEIDLKTKPADLELFFLREGAWQRVEGGIGTGRIMHEDQVPEGWAFWSPRKRRGLYQAWNRTEVGTLYLSAVGTEPTTIALDLARGRYNEAIAPGSSQTITHRFGALWNPLPLRERAG